MSRRQPPQRLRGFTIVELMIALAIGLAVTLVIAELFLSSRRTSATTDDVARMQENLRYTYHVMTRTLHVAGYRSSPSTRVSDVFATTPLLAGQDGGVGSVAPDSITVAYQGNSNGPQGVPPVADNTIFDCLGTPVAAGVLVTNRFTVEPVSAPRTGTALFCTATYPDGTATRREIVPDVENMQILYGVDADENAIVDTYVRAPAVTNMNNVRNVRIALLFRTANLGAAPAADTQSYELNDVTVPAFNDTRIRRRMIVTVNLRNRTP